MFTFSNFGQQPIGFLENIYEVHPFLFWNVMSFFLNVCFLCLWELVVKLGRVKTVRLEKLARQSSRIKGRIM